MSDFAKKQILPPSYSDAVSLVRNMNQSYSTAIDTIKSFDLTAQIVELWKMAFPLDDRYKSCKWKEMSERVSELETELFVKINNELFPISCTTWDEWADGYVEDLIIEIEPRGIYLEEDDVYTGMEPRAIEWDEHVFFLIMFAVNPQMYDDMETDAVDNWEEFSKTFKWNAPVPNRKLYSLSSAFERKLEENGLGFVPFLLEYVSKRTGNPFLDSDPNDEMFDYGEMVYYEVTQENIDYLRQAWLDAEEKIERFDAGIATLKSIPDVFRKIIETFNECEEE